MDLTIPYIQGDLVQMIKLNEIDMIVHQCNCFHTMGAGFARVLAKEFPEVYQADKETGYGDISKLGTSSVVQLNDFRYRYVANIYSQYGFGKQETQTRYDHISSGILDAVKKAFFPGVGATVGIPYRYGSGLGGGDWKLVSDEIEKAKKKSPAISYKIVVIPEMIKDAQQFLKSHSKENLLLI